MTHSILDFIGNTPLIEISRLNPNPSKVKIFAKLEYMNPGGSIKDRAALYLINEAEKSGDLTHDKIVVEATSGNTGIGLALVCAVKGYRLLLTMSEAASVERQKILRARGAEILLTPGQMGTDGAIEEAYRLGRENPSLYFVTDQFNNEANWMAHYRGTAEEIWNQTDGRITHFIATMGTTGTLMGCSRRLKEFNPEIRIIGVEPYLGHKIQGLKNLREAYVPEIFDKKRLDEKLNIEDEEAYEMARRLSKEEGLFVGMSSGAAMAMAVRKAKELEEGIIVVIFPDSGERYLSTSLFTVQTPLDFKLFNTLTRRKEVIEPILPGKINMYSCGPTAHDVMHLGECRRFVFADLIYRYLAYHGFEVNHVINITDMDDKTIEKSEKTGQSLADFTEHYIKLFKDDCDFLNIIPAKKYPKVSEHLGDMVEMTEKLVEKGVAYEKYHSIYFDISKISEYGGLSGVDLEKIRLGATVDLDEYEKENPRDFTLFRRIRLSELKRGIYIKTKWGNVRPSWHIQCAAMSMKYLGGTFDIHTSSIHLLFPHHENEMAIAMALTGKPLANSWAHCERVISEGRIVDDKGFRLTLRDLIEKGWNSRVIRFWFLSTHYRKPLTYSDSSLEAASKSLSRIDLCISSILGYQGGTPHHDIDQFVYDIRKEFNDAMDDDMNISEVMAALFKAVKKVNSLVLEKRISSEDAVKILDAFRKIDGVLGVMVFSVTAESPEINALIEERNLARSNKDWERSDRIRDRLIALGVVVQDERS
ncbi:cysteine--tRNA ligase [Desulforegula conservatrix]|uniref:cysteine--tRNA ligase n=1 Tax=Desulforegula conservatrix TaxID=153026 RepID=UPI00041A915B|nr:cysteine--tRNA ligase [Desulforegula conservatrix]